MDSNSERYQAIIQSYRRSMVGHVYIQDTMDALHGTLEQCIRKLNRPVSLLEVGCHAGITTEGFLKRCPDADFVIWDDEHSDHVQTARAQLAGQKVEFHTESLESWERPADIAISVARHHHLPASYLKQVHRLLKPDGVYLIADELCPEYCFGEHAERIAKAEVLHIIGGYVLTSHTDVEAYEKQGILPAYALDLERLRQRALWRWYRFVIDQAVDRGYFDVAIFELQSTHDDLITGSLAEHKFSSRIVERQLELAGFRKISKQKVGPADQPEHQSFVVYEYVLASS